MACIRRLPIEGFTEKMVTSKFGPRKAPVAGATTDHKGVDVGVKTGTPGYSANGGLVSYSRRQSDGKGVGEYIVILNPDGLYEIYAHLSQRLVQMGDKVEPGEKIALSGNTGASSGPHLHFGMATNYIPNNIVKSKWFDPLPFLLDCVKRGPLRYGIMKILVDGKEVEIDGRIKEGVTETTLRSCGTACGFAVTYDRDRKMPSLRSRP